MPNVHVSVFGCDLTAVPADVRLVGVFSGADGEERDVM